MVHLGVLIFVEIVLFIIIVLCSYNVYRFSDIHKKFSKKNLRNEKPITYLNLIGAILAFIAFIVLLFYMFKWDSGVKTEEKVDAGQEEGEVYEMRDLKKLAYERMAARIAEKKASQTPCTMTYRFIQ